MRMECKCGEVITTSDSPSPHILDVYYEKEIVDATKDDPELTVVNFILEWDEKNDCSKKITQRPTEVVYHFCTRCKRVYETPAYGLPGTYRVFRRKKTDVSQDDYAQWTRIFVIRDKDSYDAIEENEKTLFKDYLANHDSVRYYLSPDEKTAVAVDVRKRTVIFTYVLESQGET